MAAPVTVKASKAYVAVTSQRADARRLALKDVWLALWTSRLAVWLAAIYGVLAVGFRPTGGAPHTGAPLGNFGELVFGLAQRWDGGFYLSIAAHSYHSVPLAAFYPLYPIAIKLVGFLSGSLLIAGIAVSLAAFGAALYVLHRLTALELGGGRAQTAVLALAFFPSAMFFSMVYPQALLLALTIGAVYAGRTGRWAWAGVLGALASATHSSGVVVAVPLALLYLYGPRADRVQSHWGAKPWWRPRFALRPDFLWLGLVPLGLVAFFAYMGVAHGDALRPVRVNDMFWHRHFQLLGGITGIVGVLGHAFHSISSAPPDMLFPATNGPYRGAAVNVVDAVTLLFALVGTVGVIRCLPIAYGAYTVALLAILTSAPKPTEPLMSFPRFVLALFPLWMWLAVWLDKRGRATVWVAWSAVALGLASMQFATGRWVA